MRILLLPVAISLLTACHAEPSGALLGTLEWDRIGVAAERSEPIVAIAVREGDRVEAGALLLSLDPRRGDAELAAARAELERAEAALAELRAGSRSEEIASARASLASAEASAANARRERDRVAVIRARGLVAQASLDSAETALRTASANASALRAQLDERINGTRSEAIDQAVASVASAQATLDGRELARARLDVRAGQAGRVDALPFKLGDQPPQGAIVVSLLSGSAPYARVFVPASRRAALREGANCSVRVVGIATPFAAVLRSLRSDPAFTPYYALTGDDASRLAYRAELVLEGEAIADLPAGLPVEAECDGG